MRVRLWVCGVFGLAGFVSSSMAAANEKPVIILVGAVELAVPIDESIGKKAKGMACLPYGSLRLDDLPAATGPGWSAALVDGLNSKSGSAVAFTSLPSVATHSLSGKVVALEMKACASTSATGSVRKYKGGGQMTVRWSLVPFASGSEIAFETQSQFTFSREEGMQSGGPLAIGLKVSAAEARTKLNEIVQAGAD